MSEEEEEEEPEYTVEAIRKWTYHFTERTRKYFVKWLGYPEDQNTWEPEEHLNCPKILNAFISSLSREELRYYYCTKPEKLTGFQRNAGFLRSVGVDGPHDSDDEDSAKVRKNRLYILALFDDSEEAEEVTLQEFHRYQPEAAMQFCEERIMVQDDDDDDDSSSSSSSGFSYSSSSSSVQSCSPPATRTED